MRGKSGGMNGQCNFYYVPLVKYHGPGSRPLLVKPAYNIGNMLANTVLQLSTITCHNFL